MKPLLVTAVVAAGAALLVMPAGAAARVKPAAARAAAGANKDDGACAAGAAATVWWSPRAPVAGAALRILAVAEELREAELVVTGPDGQRRPLGVVTRGGPPWSFEAAVPSASPGSYRVEVMRAGEPVGCRTIHVSSGQSAPAAASSPAAAGGGPGGGAVVWESRLAWDRATESFYSAFIERLFDAPPDKSVDFRPLHQALRDPARNFLYNYLGLREDDPANRAAIPATPDCADLPYFLRAYFAWKLGLPFGFRDCDRGTDARPPRCQDFATNEQPPAAGKDHLGRVKSFFRLVTNHVQSGSARTALDDDETDYYPVALERGALRPGVIYADPYGHVMMIVKWIAQAGKQGGLLLAVDGQPDTSIGRKRFWEGTFLFTTDTKSAGPGFKAFRPVVRAAGGKLATLPNHAVGGVGDPGHAPYSAEQAKLPADEFYARMGKLINPGGLDAAQAYAETLDALVEQMQVRVGSVANGETYMHDGKNQREGRGPTVPMPEGTKIFETTGPWEDYATPSRDMRLIIAMNVLTGLPERIVRHPELYVLGGRKPAEVRGEIERLHEKRVSERGIEYRRSDGSPWKLTVADLLARKSALEMAYNPNDCVEVRWGAQEGTPEYATCQRHAPDDQRARMGEYRAWFREARRPPR
jgi:hypothetical protein